MIRRFRIENFKALRDVSLDLTPVHVLIGPNDAGKTSVLEALGACCRSADMTLPEAFTGRWEGLDLVWRREGDRNIVFECDLVDGEEVLTYRLECIVATTGRDARCRAETVTSGAGTFSSGASGDSQTSVFLAARRQAHDEPWIRVHRRVHDLLSGVQVYRWIPQHLALPAAPEVNQSFRVEPTGFGLARCLDEILGDDRERFDAIEARLKELFPEIRAVKLRPELSYRLNASDPAGLSLGREAGKGLAFALAGNGVEIPASQVSDGILLVLAYLTILHLPKPPRVLLIEQPENSIHPRRLRDVHRIVREVISEQQQTQVVMTTHSPYLVDLFEPEAVTLLQKGADNAVIATQLSESKSVREQVSLFTLGEIWTAEGDAALAQRADRSEAPAP